MITVDRRALKRPTRNALTLWAVLTLTLGLALGLWPSQAIAAGRVPVIIIPGVAGSTFVTGPGYTFQENNNGHGGSYQHTYGSNETVWVNVWEAALPGSDDYFDTLGIGPDADTPYIPYSNLRVGGIYDSAYGDLVDFLHRQGYVDGVTLFRFAYDWRRDIPRATLDNLDNLVNQARTAAGTSQVDLIGHSMGGLVGRNYISSPGGAAKVRRMINLGTPYLGSPKFLKALMYGDQFGPSFLGLGLDPGEVKDMVQNMAGGWELLPSLAYYSFYNNSTSGLLSPFREDRDVDGNGQVGGVLSYPALQTLLRNLGKNQNAAAFAQNLHDRLDTAWPGGPRLSFINGSGLATLGQIRDYTGSCWSWFSYHPCPKQDFLTVDGDGTVPFFSATPKDASRGLDLSGNASIHLVNREHGALVQYDTFLGIRTGDGPSLTLLGQILNNQVDPLGPGLQSNAQNTADLTASRTRLSGYWIGVTNGAELEVYNAAGAHTGHVAGQANKFERGVAGSQVETLGDSQFVYLPAGNRYNLRMKATAAGAFDLKIRQLDGDDIAQSALYLNVPVQAGGEAQLDFAGLNGSLPALRVDSQGNGNFDRTVKANLLDRAASQDKTGPTVNVVAPRVVKTGSFTARWQADDSLSGLSLQQGLLDRDTASAQVVANGQSLKLSPGRHSLQVLAQDRAGNTSVREVEFQVS